MKSQITPSYFSDIGRVRSLSGKVAVITGAANGIGRALALRLANHGCQIALVDIDHPNLIETQQQLGDSRNSTHVVDLGKKDQIRSLVGSITAIHGRVDILINNGGVSIDAPLVEQSEEDIDWITSINYLGLVYCCRFFLPEILKQREGHIVNVSSAAGIQGFPLKTTYCGSKSAITGFSEALRAELYPSNIGVTIAYPGPVKTHMLTRSRVSDENRRDQIHSYLMNKGMPPDRVAKEIIGAILSNTGKIMITRQSKATSLIKRIFPGLFGKWIARNQDKLPA